MSKEQEWGWTALHRKTAPGDTRRRPALSCPRRYVAYRLVHCRAIRSCSALLVMYCVAMLPTSGSAAKEAEAGQSGQRSAPRSRGHGGPGRGRKGRGRVLPGAGPPAGDRIAAAPPPRHGPDEAPWPPAGRHRPPSPWFSGGVLFPRRREWGEPGLHPGHCWGGSSRLVSR